VCTTTKSTDFVAVLTCRNLRQLFALTDGVDETPDSKQDEISEELEQFEKRQHSEAEPQAEHSTKIRHVSCTLHIEVTIIISRTGMAEFAGLKIAGMENDGRSRRGEK